MMGMMDNQGMAQGGFPEEQGRVKSGSPIPTFWVCVSTKLPQKKFQGRENSVTFVYIFFHDHKLSFLN